MALTSETYSLEFVVVHDAPLTVDDHLAIARLPNLLKETEENLTDLLPDGWTVRIQPQGGNDE